MLKRIRRKVVFVFIVLLSVYAIFYSYINVKSRKIALKVLNSVALPVFASLTDDYATFVLPKVTIESRMNKDNDIRSFVVAVGGGLTSRGTVNVSTSNAAAKFNFFHTFMPTFCKTANPDYIYRFYLAFDVNDRVFASNDLATSFKRTFTTETSTLCERPRGVRTSLHLVHCDHTGSPAWAQNDAMLEAYIDHADYYYRMSRFVLGKVQAILK